MSAEEKEKILLESRLTKIETITTTLENNIKELSEISKTHTIEITSLKHIVERIELQLSSLYKLIDVNQQSVTTQLKELKMDLQKSNHLTEKIYIFLVVIGTTLVFFKDFIIDVLKRMLS